MANEIEQEDRALKEAYKSWLLNLPKEPKTYEASDIVRDVSSAKGVLGKIGAGFAGALRYAGTGQGKQLVSGLLKDPTSAVGLWKLGTEQEQEESARQQAYQNAISERMKEIGSTLREQERTQQMLEQLKYERGEKERETAQKAVEQEQEKIEKEQAKAEKEQTVEEERNIDAAKAAFNKGQISAEELQDVVKNPTSKVIRQRNFWVRLIPFVKDAYVTDVEKPINIKEINR